MYLVVLVWIILAVTSAASLFVGAIAIPSWDAMEFLLGEANCL